MAGRIAHFPDGGCNEGEARLLKIIPQIIDQPKQFPFVQRQPILGGIGLALQPQDAANLTADRCCLLQRQLSPAQGFVIQLGTFLP